MTYREAIEELETILRALETDAVDVDDLTTRVERSAELIRLCRHKLRHAEASLDRVFDSLKKMTTRQKKMQTTTTRKLTIPTTTNTTTCPAAPAGPGNPSADGIPFRQKILWLIYIEQ
jgi:exodeoxyribonuclease VII small subunit